MEEMEERQEDPEKKRPTAETSDDTTVDWDLEEDEDRRREVFEIYCGIRKEDLEETEEERKKEKEKAEKLEEMRERWRKEESERSLEERKSLEDQRKAWRREVKQKPGGRQNLCFGYQEGQHP